MDAIFGSEPEVAQPTPEDMEARARETEPYWRNYQRFVADVEGERASGAERLDLQRRMGTISDEAYQNALDALEQDYQSRLAEIQAGPTYDLLTSEYEAQREYAEQRHGWEQSMAETQFYRDNPRRFAVDVEYPGGRLETFEGASYREPQTGGGDLQEPGGYYLDQKRISGMGVNVLGATQTSPEFQRAESQFPGSLEDYYAGLFAGEAAPVDARRAELRAPQPGGGSRRQSAIGVGQIYSWY